MSDIEAWLVGWFEDKSKINKNDISLSDSYFEQNLVDSFGVIELIDDIETNYEVQLNESHFQDRDFVTIKGLANIIFKMGCA